MYVDFYKILTPNYQNVFLLSPSLISFPYIKTHAYPTKNTIRSERKKLLLKLNVVFKTDFSLINLIFII